MKKMNKKGFTIVELVVVIAVIAILAAVMIPTFGGIVEKANVSKAIQEAQNIRTNDIIAIDGQVEKYIPDETYVKVTGEFDEDETYYTFADDVYTVAEIEAFADGVDYYVDTENTQGVFTGDLNHYSVVVGEYTVTFDGVEWTAEKGN